MGDGAGRVGAIWIKRVRLGPMDPASEARAVAGRGLEGNANQGGKRQVTVLDRAAWARAEAELGLTVDPRERRANVLLEGLDLASSRGRILRLGEVRLRVWGETRPCRRMDEAQPGLQATLDPEWRGGIYTEVLDDGLIRVGDPALWV